MASDFLRRKAKKQAEELEKEYGSSAYGGTTWLKEQEEKRKAKKSGNDDDIAPVESKKEEEKQTWFSAGAFGNGYQFGDVTKSLLGTVGEGATNAVEGVGKMVGGVVDLGTYGVAGVADFFGADEAAKSIKEFGKRNIIDETFAPWDDYLDRYSLIGEKSESVFEGLGQVGAIVITGGAAGAAAGAAGASSAAVGAASTAATTGLTFLSSSGSGMSEAYQGGATDDEALTYGFNQGLIDAGTELLFGGLGKGVKALGVSKGLSSLDDMFARKLSSKIANQTAKNWVEFGVKSGFEGFEEVLAGAGSAVNKKLTYMTEADLKQLVEDEQLLDQFVIGAVTSSFAQSGLVPGMKAGSLKESIDTGRDLITGLDANEQAVVDKEYESRIAEKETNGEKLTKKEKSEIYDQVLSDMENGEISTDTIEEVLGGDSYKAYKDAVDKENEVLKEFGELYEGDELVQQVADFMKTAESKNLKSKLGEDVFNGVQNSRLVESYYERGRRGEAFQADLSKYDEKQRAVVQSAIDSGILNNTRRTHLFVDILARISADKGVPFNFTDNAKLKESGFAVEGKQVNGFVTENGITLNIDSPKAWQSTVGHEIAHVLEGTELYGELQTALFEYAKSRKAADSKRFDSEYKERLYNARTLYKDVEGYEGVKGFEKIKREVVSDLVGDYLFTDADFVNNLSANHRNVFQKIYDEVKYLCKVATAGSKEARQLEKVKKAFDKAYKEGGKGTADTKYSITEAFVDSDGNHYDNAVLLDTDFFDGISPRNWGEKLRVAVNERANTDPFILPIVDENGNTTVLQFASTKDRAKKDGGAEHRALDKLSSTSDNISKLAVIHIDEIVSVSEENSPYYTNENSHGWLDQNGWLHRNANVINQRNGNIYNLTVDIAKAADGRTILYATDGKIKKVGNVKVDSLKIKGPRQNSDFDGSKPQNGKNVKRNYSLSDSNGKQLTAEQQEYFKRADSEHAEAVKNRDWEAAEKLVDEAAKQAGYTRVVYHGTESRFTVFDTDEESTSRPNHAWMADYPDGTIFLAESPDVADYYGDRVMSLLLDTSDIKVFEEPDMYAHQAMDDKYGYEVYNYPVIAVKGKDMTIYATLDNTAVKSADTATYDDNGNLIPLSERFNHADPDIRYSLSKEVDANYLDAVNRGDTETAQQMVLDVGKDAGYTVRAYHGTRRGDRVGNVFLPERATSGPMAFFTDSKEIAEHYARDKADTSLAYDEEYEDYYSQFRVNQNGKSIKVQDLWRSLPFAEKQRLKEAGKHITWDEDMTNIVWDDDATHGLGNWDAYTLNLHKGNAIEALIDCWLESGELYGNEGDFIQVLEMAGIKGVEYRDPDARHDKVYDTLLKIQNPFDTATVDDSFADGFEAWYSQQPDGKYDRDTANADMWDKNSQTAETFLDRLRDDIEDGTTRAWTSIPDSVTDYLKSLGYDGIKDTGGKNGGAEHTVWIPFTPEQIKSADTVTYDDNGNVIPLSERFNETEVDIRRSLSKKDKAPVKYGNFSTPARDLKLETAPVREDVSKTETTTPVQEAVTGEDVQEMFPDDLAPTESYEGLVERRGEILRQVQEADLDTLTEEAIEALESEYMEIEAKLADMSSEADTMRQDGLDSMTDEDAPPESVANYQTDSIAPEDPFYDRDIGEVGNRSVKAYMYENPEVKPFFQQEALGMLSDLRDSIKGERWYIDQVYYDTNGEKGWGGTKRHTTDDIAELLDNYGYSYAEIQKGLDAIIEDNGAENNACSKRIEFMLNDRLMYGYTNIEGRPIPPNQDYINLLNEKQINEYSREAFNALTDADAPPVEDIAPIAEGVKAESTESVAPVAENVPPAESHPAIAKAPTKETPKTAKIVYGGVEQKKKLGAWKWTQEHIFRRGAAVEDLALKTGNRELYARFDNIRRAENAAQHFIANGEGNVKALKSIYDEVVEAGKLEAFDEYLYHMHNVDRMSIETPENRAVREGLKAKFNGYTDKQIADIATEWITKDTPADVVERINNARAYLEAQKHKDKPVWGYDTTADISRAEAAKLEKANPKFKEWTEQLYGINKHLRQMLVDDGQVAQDVSDLWEKMYPHYVPIKRVDKNGQAVSVPLDTNRTGVNAPIQRATGGNSDFYDVFTAMGDRIEQTYRAVARNRFGVELKNTLGTDIESEAEQNGILPEGTVVRAHDRENIGVIKGYNEETGKYTVRFENKRGYSATKQLDAKVVTPLNPAKKSDNSSYEALDNVDLYEELLQEGKDGQAPTFTVFEKGKRVKFAIPEEIFESMKPSRFTYTNKYLNAVNNFRTKTLTQYSPKFLLNNPFKDLGDVVVNSQHPVRTYLHIPSAIKQIMTKGEYYQERMKHGGGGDTYFDSQKKVFKPKKSMLSKTVGFPFELVSNAQELLEQVPRLAEYIASRKMGRSIDVSMLDAGQVTTNFGAAGDLTNLANRNGVTFLSASVEGFNQQVRNIRQAKAEGLKGWVKLAAKYMVAGLPAMLLNHALWDDDEEYEELSDYVKQNYYIVGKFGDGKFVRIPKGRAVAVIQSAFEQMEHLVTGDDEVDLAAFADLAFTNLAPNSPLDNNIASPIWQVMQNKTWYGDDLVPTRLEDAPKGEQFDETTDAISRWLGETFPDHISPIKANYLLDQYGGIFSDIGLPMITPKAESGDDTMFGNLIAPIRDQFTTDSVLKNQNVSDFYDKTDELTANANSMYATDEDILKAKYMNSVSGEMGALYGAKRKIQNSDLPNSQKYEDVREAQRRIDDLARNALASYENVKIDGKHAQVGDVQFRWYEPGEDSDAEPGWKKLTADQLEQQEEVTRGLGISAGEYWNNKAEYDFAYEKPEKYAVAKSVGGYEAYKGYQSDLYDIKADKDSKGKSITGSRKEKVADYINGLDADYGEKIILFKSEYPADDSYNMDIIDYLNSRDDISYKEMVDILKELGFEVDSKGNIYWD